VGSSNSRSGLRLSRAGSLADLCRPTDLELPRVDLPEWGLFSSDLLPSWKSSTCSSVTVWMAVAESQVPRPCGPNCDSALFASTTVTRSDRAGRMRPSGALVRMADFLAQGGAESDIQPDADRAVRGGWRCGVGSFSEMTADDRRGWVGDWARNATSR
jgi:hypothetical protein